MRTTAGNPEQRARVAQSDSELDGKHVLRTPWVTTPCVSESKASGGYGDGNVPFVPRNAPDARHARPARRNAVDKHRLHYEKRHRTRRCRGDPDGIEPCHHRERVVSWTRLDDGASQWRHFTRLTSVFSGQRTTHRKPLWFVGGSIWIVDPTDKPSMDLGTFRRSGGHRWRSRLPLAARIRTSRPNLNSGRERRRALPEPGRKVVDGCPLVHPSVLAVLSLSVIVAGA